MFVIPSLQLSASYTSNRYTQNAEQYLKRYSPACTRLLSQYKTMLKLVASDVPNVEDFMKRYRVS